MGSDDDGVVIDEDIKASSTQEQTKENEEKASAVGNLVENDEWEGLTMELSEVIQMAVVEDMKKNAREFLGNDEYKLGDITKEIDTRVKSQVATMRGKEEYEIGDLVVVMDSMAKDMTEDLTGKPYEAGDLSLEIDKRVKNAVAEYCGNDEYQFGDLSKQIDLRVKDRVAEYLGEDAAKDYMFGDIT